MNISPANLQLQLAGLRGQLLGSLFDQSSPGAGTADFAGILGMKTAGIAATGRNTALRDPEAGYSMMSRINELAVNFKAQFTELSAMGDAVEHMEMEGRELAGIDATTADTEIVARLRDFVAEYNAWEDRFDDTVAQGGVLDNIQAAEISLYELEQSVASIFNGAAGGVSGLRDLGITIDPATKQAVLDEGRLKAVLASNRQGAIGAIDEFSANFAKSADLLNSEGNFIPTQLDNRSRAINFIADNLTNLQAEFGTGDAAQPTGDIARALAAYQSTFGIK